MSYELPKDTQPAILTGSNPRQIHMKVNPDSSLNIVMDSSTGMMGHIAKLYLESAEALREGLVSGVKLNEQEANSVMADYLRSVETKSAIPNLIRKQLNVSVEVLAPYTILGDENRIVEFINNSGMGDVIQIALESAPILLPDLFVKEAKLSLKLIEDWQGLESANLFILVKTDLDVIEAEEKLNNFKSKYWIAFSKQLKGKLLLDVDLES